MQQQHAQVTEHVKTVNASAMRVTTALIVHKLMLTVHMVGQETNAKLLCVCTTALEEESASVHSHAPATNHIQESYRTNDYRISKNFIIHVSCFLRI